MKLTYEWQAFLMFFISFLNVYRIFTHTCVAQMKLEF